MGKRSHSRALKMTPFDRLHTVMTSRSYSIVTLLLACIVPFRQRDIAANSQCDACRSIARYA